jgi:serine/threonine protein phosphatase PrpC
MKANQKPVEGSETGPPPQPRAPAGVKLENPPSSLVEVDLAAQSHAGTARPNNEDRYLIVRLERSLQAVLSNLPESVLPHISGETAYGLVVADGVGRMPAGGIASSIAVRKLVDLVVKTPDWIMKMSRRKAVVVKRRLTRYFRRIDTALREQGEKDPRISGMGTTLTVACSLGADLFLAHIGDSRAYLLRADKLYQLTRDHTFARALIKARGTNTKDAVLGDMRRVLTAALGSSVEWYEPDIQRLYLRHGDRLLLCTDGLNEWVDAENIGSILRNANSADEACRALIKAALRVGGNNDITVVLAWYRFPQIASQQPPYSPRQSTDV